MTAALELKRRLKRDVKVTVLDPCERFTFVPSLIWMPFGLRGRDDISFPLEPMYARKGIRFHQLWADAIDPLRRVVTTADGELPYDRLVIEKTVLSARRRGSLVA